MSQSFTAELGKAFLSGSVIRKTLVVWCDLLRKQSFYQMENETWYWQSVELHDERGSDKELLTITQRSAFVWQQRANKPARPWMLKNRWSSTCAANVKPNCMFNPSILQEQTHQTLLRVSNSAGAHISPPDRSIFCLTSSGFKRWDSDRSPLSSLGDGWEMWCETRVIWESICCNVSSFVLPLTWSYQCMCTSFKSFLFFQPVKYFFLYPEKFMFLKR